MLGWREDSRFGECLRLERTGHQHLVLCVLDVGVEGRLAHAFRRVLLAVERHLILLGVLVAHAFQRLDVVALGLREVCRGRVDGRLGEGDVVLGVGHVALCVRNLEFRVGEPGLKRLEGLLRLVERGLRLRRVVVEPREFVLRRRSAGVYLLADVLLLRPGGLFERRLLFGESHLGGLCVILLLGGVLRADLLGMHGLRRLKLDLLGPERRLGLIEL